MNDSTITTTSKQFGLLLENTKYYWRVNSKNQGVYSDWSDVWNFTTIISAPTNLTLQRTALKEITLSWNDNSNSKDGYIIERKQNSQTNYSLLDTLKGSGNKYIDNKVEQGMTYSYRIKAYKNISQSDYSNEASIIVVGVAKFNNIPTEYLLLQSYPNPFNPTTTINYSLPKESRVTITLYNILGQKITDLVNEIKLVGNFRVDWNATRYASGVYFYRMTALPINGDAAFMKTREMILMK